MTEAELHELIGSKNDQLQNLVFTQAETFVFNPQIAILQNEIMELQNQCHHKFNDFGFCEICYKYKEEQHE